MKHIDALAEHQEKASERPQAGPYVERDGRLVWLKPTKDGQAPVELANFVARIDRQVARDDGAEVTRTLELEAVHGGRRRRFELPASKFAAMGWPVEYVGASAILAPGMGLRDHARAAIQQLSGEVPEATVYGHVGWRKIESRWAYLHAGGAIGSEGLVEAVDVDPGALALMKLPPPPAANERVRAIQASLGVLEVVPPAIAFPLLAAVYRAPLGAVDFSLFLAGQTGAGKSELAALAQQHFGAALDARHLPGSWSSTGNALEGLAFAGKDALLVVDDFCPTGSSYDVQRYHREADRLLRAQGNVSGRQRMRADGTLRAPRPPRGLVVATGEEVPHGQSLRARLLILELAAAALQWERLTEAQRDAAAGLYASALAGFLQWLAGDLEDRQAALRERALRLRAQASASMMHRRTPDIVASLQSGFELFLLFAVEAGAVDESKAEELRAACWSALGKAVEAQAEHFRASNPAERFLELLASALASGSAHLANEKGEEPRNKPEAWGWRSRVVGNGLNERLEWQPQGRRAGWITGDDVYLIPEAALSVAAAQASNGDGISLSGRTLWKRLDEAGLLASTDSGRNLTRFMAEGQRRRVLHLRVSTVGKSGPTGPTGPRASNDGGPWPDSVARFSEQAGLSGHKNGPQTPTPRGSRPDWPDWPDSPATRGPSSVSDEDGSQEAREERAAIAEHEGGLSRQAADDLAEELHGN